MTEIPSELLDTIQNCSYQELMSKIPDTSVDVLFTDPPYNLMIQGEKWDKDFNMELWLKSVLPKVKEDGLLLIFNTKDNIERIIIPFLEDFHDDQHTFQVLKVIDWSKTNPRQNIDTYRKHEFLLVASNISKVRDENPEDMGRMFQNIFDFNIEWDTAKELKIFQLNDANKKKHPTAKPIRLLEQIIRKTTKVDDVVMDTTSGTGSIAIASYRMCRHFIACELDKQYAEDSIYRLKQIQRNVPRSPFITDWHSSSYIELWNEEELTGEKSNYSHGWTRTNKFINEFRTMSVDEIRKVVVKALYKFDKDKEMNSLEKLVVNQRYFEVEDNLDELLETNNDYELAGLKDYDELYDTVGRKAVELNLYSTSEILGELRTLMSINNAYIDTDNREKSLKAIIKDINNIPAKLIADGQNVNMKTILQVFKGLLYDAKVCELAKDIEEHYYNYKGWKMINIVVNCRYKTDIKKDFRLYHAKDRFFFNGVLDDLKNFERFIIAKLIDGESGKGIKDYEELVSFYYKEVFIYLFNEDNSLLNVYKKLLDEGFYSDLNERFIRDGIKYIATATQHENMFGQPFSINNSVSMNELVRKLHITRDRAFKYDLKDLYLYTVSRRTRNRIVNSTVATMPKSIEEVQKERLDKRIEIGKDVKQYLDEGLNISQVAGKIKLSRRLVSAKYKDYVLSEYKSERRKKKLQTSQDLVTFAKRMHLTLYKLNKLIAK